MLDGRFYKSLGPFKISKIVEVIHCRLFFESSEDILIHNITTLEDAQEGDLSFLNNKKYLDSFKNTKASACIVPENLDIESFGKVILLKVKNPYFSYGKAINLFYEPNKNYSSEIMPSCYIAKTANIGRNCYIGHNVVIEDNVNLGDNCIIESGVVIGHGVKIGNNARISPNVVINYSIIGDNVVILAGAKIGQDGFGFATEHGRHHKIFHIGRVIIGNDVEIGANTTIDRGSVTDTIISDFCRIDNLVQIGHNVQIGKGSILVAQVGVAGSSKLGNYCVLGGQVGVAGHLTIGDYVQIASKSGIAKDVESNSIVGGIPAVPIRDWHKQTIIMKKLVKQDRQ